jgi:spore maturation protein CgeB
MRILIINTDYPQFLKSLYSDNYGLKNAPYAEQMIVRMDTLFGVSDFYSSNLIKNGHEAYDLYANNEFMQKAWLREYKPGMGTYRNNVAINKIRSTIFPYSTWFYKILGEQIKYYHPDVILNQAIDGISSGFMKKMKPHCKLLVGQIASPLPKNDDLRIYDLILSSLPNFVEYFNSIGINSELNRLAFEPKVLEKIKQNEKNIPISFVGSLSLDHLNRIKLLEYLCTSTPIKIWGNGIENIPSTSPIHKSYIGSAWGIQMYQILHDSKVTINNHIGIADNYANNMRLFEATGSGTLLITDWKKNLCDMFEPGKEIVVYRNDKECVELIDYYLIHDEERCEIAHAGQTRALKEHTYYNRMKELISIVEKYT